MSEDSRHSVRFGVTDELRPALVRLGWKKWRAELVDESAGGFSFTTSPEAPLKAGQIITLIVHSGEHQVEVIRVAVEGDRVLVGARRCEEDWRDRPRSAGRRGCLDPHKQAAPHSTANVLIFAAFVAAAVLAIVCLTGNLKPSDIISWLR
ncbi:MAG: hypothetical protein KY475_21610 [Planctomycetes bacterium]|nr:hypothetical protein [Planctomycetota bacterium]